MKFKVVFSILILLIISSFTYAIYLSLKLERTNIELAEEKLNLQTANDKIILLETTAKEELEKCLKEGDRNSWEIASRTNTLIAYSTYKGNCNGEEGGCNESQLNKAVNSLFNAEGYVQMVETNGNELYTPVNLNLEGEFIKFKTDKAVRNGAIGIPKCGASRPTRTGGIVLKGQIVRVLDKCPAPGSESVWVHFKYTK